MNRFMGSPRVSRIFAAGLVSGGENTCYVTIFNHERKMEDVSAAFGDSYHYRLPPKDDSGEHVICVA